MKKNHDKPVTEELERLFKCINAPFIKAPELGLRYTSLTIPRKVEEEKFQREQNGLLRCEEKNKPLASHVQRCMQDLRRLNEESDLNQLYTETLIQKGIASLEEGKSKPEKLGRKF